MQDKALLNSFSKRSEFLGRDFDFNFVVARKSFPSQYPSDSNYRHEFDGVKIVVTHE